MNAPAAERTTIRELVPLCFVDDIQRSLEFYERSLEFRRSQSWEHDGQLAWCRLERDGTAIMLQQICDEDNFTSPRGDGITLFFQCDDAADVYARLKNRDIAVDPPAVTFFGMQQVFVSDPDGYRLCFQNPVPREDGSSAESC